MPMSGPGGRGRSTSAFNGPMHSSEVTTAPRKAPIAPGTARHTILDQCTLPNRQCETPDIAQVPTSAMCTLAEARAGEMPTANSSVVDVTP